MEELKIVFCAYDKLEMAGGPMVWLMRLATAFQDRNVHATYLLLTWDDPEEGVLKRQLQNLGLSVICRKFTTTEENVKWILDETLSLRPDVCVINHVTPAWYAARWLQDAGIPCIGVLHSDDSFYRALRERFLSGGEWQVTRAVAVSELLASSLPEGSRSGTKMTRISYGVPVPELNSTTTRKGFTICYLGRLAEEQKRISTVAHALCRAVQEIPESSAVIYGDGPDRPAVEQILAQQGPGLPVVLGGSLTPAEVQTHLLECEALLLLSDYEGLPIAVLEAMACGVVPVCLAMRSGIPEIVGHEVTGLIVENRHDDVISALKRLREDVNLRQRLSLAARQLVIDQFSLETMADSWSKYLREVSGKNTEHRPLAVRLESLPPVHPDLALEDVRALVPDFRRNLFQHWVRIRRHFTGYGTPRKQ